MVCLAAHFAAMLSLAAAQELPMPLLADVPHDPNHWGPESIDDALGKAFHTAGKPNDGSTDARLVGGYQMGDHVYHLGTYHHFESGDKLMYRATGVVLGPADGDGSRLAVLWAGNQRHVTMLPESISHKAPPESFPGGYKAGDRVHYLGTYQKFESGDELVYGATGVVQGPTDGSGCCLAVLWAGNRRYVTMPPESISHEVRPVLPGGYKVNEELYYVGATYIWPSGNKAEYGNMCVVKGTNKAGDELAVFFEGNDGNVIVPPDQLSREIDRRIEIEVEIEAARAALDKAVLEKNWGDVQIHSKQLEELEKSKIDRHAQIEAEIEAAREALDNAVLEKNWCDVQTHSKQLEELENLKQS